MAGRKIIYFALIVYFIIFAFFMWNRNIFMGDIVFHTARINEFVEGNLKWDYFNGNGDYIAIYPKLYHITAGIFSLFIGVQNSIKLVSLLCILLSGLLIFLMARMFDEGSALVCFLFSFVFMTHFNYFFWGGFPSQLSEVFALAAIFALLRFQGNLKVQLAATLLFIGIISLVHAFYLVVIIAPFFSAFLFLPEARKTTVLFFAMGLSVCVLLVLFTKMPAYLPYFIQHSDVIKDVLSDSMLLPRFLKLPVPGIIAAASAYFIIKKHGEDRMVKFLVGWLALHLLLLLAFFIAGVRTVDIQRTFEKIYVPFSLVGGLGIMLAAKRLKISKIIVYLLIFAASALVIITEFSYHAVWIP